MEKVITTTLTPLELETLVSDAVRRGLKKLYLDRPEQQEPVDKPLSVDEVCELTHLSKPTIYKLVQNQDIPYFRRAKRLYFDRQKILDWMAGKNERPKVSGDKP